MSLITELVAANLNFGFSAGRSGTIARLCRMTAFQGSRSGRTSGRQSGGQRMRATVAGALSALAACTGPSTRPETPRLSLRLPPQEIMYFKGLI